MRLSQLGLPLLLLMAMGNWGNTPTPPPDPDAPDPVGNDGELSVEIDGDRVTYLVQSAGIGEGILTISGEKVEGRPQFLLLLNLPATVYDGTSLNVGVLRRASLAVKAGSTLLDASGREVSVSGGSLQVSGARGSGPWEIDGELDLASSVGPITGRLEARVTG